MSGEWLGANENNEIILSHEHMFSYTKDPLGFAGWHHLAFTYDGSAKVLAAYVDGMQMRAVFGHCPGRHLRMIGNAQCGYATTFAFGVLAEVRMWFEPLHTAQIKHLYNHGKEVRAFPFFFSCFAMCCGACLLAQLVSFPFVPVTIPTPFPAPLYPHLLHPIPNYPPSPPILVCQNFEHIRGRFSATSSDSSNDGIDELPLEDAMGLSAHKTMSAVSGMEVSDDGGGCLGKCFGKCCGCGRRTKKKGLTEADISAKKKRRLAKAARSAAPVTVSLFRDEVLFGVDGPAVYGWNVKSGEVVAAFTGHSHDVVGIAVEGNILYTASMDHTVRQWDITSGSLLHTFAFGTSEVCVIGWLAVVALAVWLRLSSVDSERGSCVVASLNPLVRLFFFPFRPRPTQIRSFFRTTNGAVLVMLLSGDVTMVKSKTSKRVKYTDTQATALFYDGRHVFIGDSFGDIRVCSPTDLKEITVVKYDVLKVC